MAQALEQFRKVSAVLTANAAETSLFGLRYELYEEAIGDNDRVHLLQSFACGTLISELLMHNGQPVAQVDAHSPGVVSFPPGRDSFWSRDMQVAALQTLAERLDSKWICRHPGVFI